MEISCDRGEGPAVFCGLLELKKQKELENDQAKQQLEAAETLLADQIKNICREAKKEKRIKLYMKTLCEK